MNAEYCQLDSGVVYLEQDACLYAGGCVLKWAEKLSPSLLVKLIVIYSLITTIIVSFLVFVFIKIFNNTIIEKEIIVQKKMVDDVAGYFDEKIASAHKIVENLYATDAETRSFILHNEKLILSSTMNDYVVLKKRSSKWMDTNLKIDDDILDIILVSLDLKEYTSYSRGTSRHSMTYNAEGYNWFDRLVGSSGGFIFTTSYIVSSEETTDRPVFSAVTKLFDDGFRDLQYLIINFDVSSIGDFDVKHQEHVKSGIMVFDEEGYVIYDSSASYYRKPYPYYTQLLQEPDGWMQLEQFSMVNTRISKNGILAASIAPQTYLLSGSANTIKFIYGLLFFSVIFSASMIYVASRFFYKKIQFIKNSMREVEKGNLRARIPINASKDEFNYIAVSFNSMCKRLEEYIEQVYVFDIRRKNAEIVALQNQISPHFLNNTLEIIRMKALIDHNYDVSQMIYKLAQLLRIRLNNKENTCELREELENCETFIEIHNYREQGRLHFITDIDKQLLDFRVPKLILQPIIENAVVHCENEQEELCIHVVCAILEGQVVITVADNGGGIEPERLEEIRRSLQQGEIPKGKIGLGNVHERTKLMFGESYGLSLASQHLKGTTVTLTLPPERKEEG